jgi:hypothetical protein
MVVLSRSCTGYEIVSEDMRFEDYGTWPVSLVLDVPAYSTVAGTPIQQWHGIGGWNQQWLPRRLGGGQMFVWGSGNAIMVSGFGFWPGTKVCPVFDYKFTPPCTTVPSDGTFSSTVTNFNGFVYSSGSSGHVVVVLENGVGNVLAIDDVFGGFNNPTPIPN